MTRIRRSLCPDNRIPLMITRDELEFFFAIQGPETVCKAGAETTIHVERFTSGTPILAGGGMTYTLRYRGTDTVSWYPDGTVTLSADRAESEALMRRMNLALVPLGWKLYAETETREWFLWRIRDMSGNDLPFRNGMIVARAYDDSEHNGQ